MQLLRARAGLARVALEAFASRFGDTPVRVFRAPGRVNVRGMHVDTHGGWLNLMTHQREVMLVAGLGRGHRHVAANTCPDFEETEFILSEERCGNAPGMDWFSFISRPDIRERVSRRAASGETGWANYIIGAALQTQWRHPAAPLHGLNIMVHSDLPQGAALSSSAALSVAALIAYARCNGHKNGPEALIPAEQDVEWYAGARVGMSDQTAILLGRPDAVLHVALFAGDFNLATAVYVPFPETLDLLVVNSFTTRNLSGAQRLKYSLNRFAYSMAMPVLRVELQRSGYTRTQVRRMDRLSRMTPDSFGGPVALYRLLRAVPETIAVEELRARYQPPDLDAAYARYFDGIDAAVRPEIIPLRGPLMFGIAESERARLFPSALASGDYACAGRLMSVGHDGDRVRDRNGDPFRVDICDAALDAMAEAAAPVQWQPGVYGASSPALDALVDTALDAGALGASLTGAGIAGVVLALCRRGNSAAVADAVRRRLQDDDYARLAGLPEAPSVAAADDAVVINRAVAGAGELTLGGDCTGGVPGQ